MPGSDSNALFISHNVADRPFAIALHSALNELVAGASPIDVRYSTSDEAGPQGGEKWRDWIHRQVVEARSALILVTPHALGKPWLLWEAGACLGASLARRAARASAAEDDGRLIVSIAYGLAESECPDPLRGEQIVPGTDHNRMAGVFESVLHAHGVSPHQLMNAGRRMSEVMERYVAAVRVALRQAPSLVTEPNVQDWLSRLDALVRNDRLSELQGFERWMTLAFGREGEAAAIPIDVRLHRRLGELYLGQKAYARASHQLRLAWRAAPRDIYVLRPLAEARMKHFLAEGAAKDVPDAREEMQSLLAAIEDIDREAFVSMPDAAALLAKYHRRASSDVPRAIEVLHKSFAANPQSYYLADLLAQAQLEIGDRDEALRTYRRALAIVDRLDEKNIWSCATAATAAVALGDIVTARRWLAAVCAAGPPSPSELETIHRGLREVAARAGVAAADVDDLMQLSAETSPGQPT
jgi:tetratricopeptide (TPR) repeat protein